MARKAGSSITALLETGTVDSLLEAWRQTRAPEIADALDQVPFEDLDDVITGNSVEGLARLTRIPEVIDPRIAERLVRWLAAPPWHAGRGKPFFQQVFKRLVAIDDPRTLQTLPAARKAVRKAVKGASMRGWFVEHIDKTIAALSERPTALAVSDARLIERARKAFAKQPPAKQQPSKLTNAAAELLAAIHADPADDGARQVYADVLTEKSDPRGVFITMQLARAGQPPSKEQSKRELAVLAKHVRVWLGELGAVVGRLSRFRLSVGPERVGGIRFDRGFLAGCVLRGSRNKLAAIAKHPYLATVEELELDNVHGHLVLASSDLPALDELTISSAHLPTLVARPAAAHVRALTLWDIDRGDAFFTDVEACAELPALRVLRLLPDTNRLDAHATRSIGAAFALRQVETVQLAIFHHRGDGAFVRKGKAWTFVPSELLSASNTTRYRALCAT